MERTTIYEQCNAALFVPSYMVYNKTIPMPIQTIKRDIKRHRPIDWFAIVVLISFAFIVGSVMSAKVDKFSQDMDREVERLLKAEMFK